MKYRVLTEVAAWEVEADSMQDAIRQAKDDLLECRDGYFSPDRVATFAERLEPGSVLEPVEEAIVVYDRTDDYWLYDVSVIEPPEPPCKRNPSGEPHHDWQPEPHSDDVYFCLHCGMRTDGELAAFWFPPNK
jgi:hypothetical protein